MVSLEQKFTLIPLAAPPWLKKNEALQKPQFPPFLFPLSMIIPLIFTLYPFHSYLFNSHSYICCFCSSLKFLTCLAFALIPLCLLVHHDLLSCLLFLSSQIQVMPTFCLFFLPAWSIISSCSAFPQLVYNHPPVCLVYPQLHGKFSEVALN